MKKFLAIFLVLTLLFSFAACNKDETPNSDDESTSGQKTEQTNSGEEDTTKKKPRPETTTAAPFENPNLTEPAALFKLVDVSNYNLKSAEPNTSKSSGVTLIVKRYENKNFSSNILPATINIEGTEFVLNETILKDFNSKNWIIASKNDANTAVEVGKEANVLVKNSSGDVVMIVVKNKTSHSVAMADCTVTKVSINKAIKQRTWAEFTIDGKVNTSTSSYADFVNTFGSPKSINVGEYYKGNDYTHCKATMIFEKTAGNETWTMTVSCVEENGKMSIESCIYEVK